MSLSTRRISISFTLFIVMILSQLCGIGISSEPTSDGSKRSTEASSQRATGSITLDPDSEYVDVGPEDNGIVKFSGFVQIEVSGPDVEMIAITLFGESDHFDLSISPSTLHFPVGSSEEKPFEVVVKVPLSTSSVDVYKIHIYGEAKGATTKEEFPVEPAEGIIVVRQFYQIEMEPHWKTTIHSGDDVEIEIKLHNKGNGRDRVRLGVPDKWELKEKGIIIKTDEDWIEIPAGGYANAFLQVSVDEELSHNIEMINVTVISDYALETEGYGPVGNGSFSLKIKSDEGFLSLNDWEIYGLIGLAVILNLILLIYYLVKRKQRRI